MVIEIARTGNTVIGKAKSKILLKKVCNPSWSFRPIKWLNFAIKGLKTIPKTPLKYSINVKPMAKIANCFAPNSFEITKGSNS